MASISRSLTPGGKLLMGLFTLGFLCKVGFGSGPVGGEVEDHVEVAQGDP